ncbi:hypothetical protein B0H67DRAFT_567802 [Lasiosphaeris hirsuta]|uniref:Uncharacterized protein n=1 Tax=Lasiosphaeris hirsuta TaxID=260670 RepID=A0AA40AYJ3_9PEZI|nr:hypothetical protein B0H67DRAFT_567802 [Lasiosphaeris hirsuta]
MPDNWDWVARKRNSVLRWGRITWYLSCKYAGDEEAFRRKFQLSGEQASKYSIHGGAIPIRVPGVEGIVGIVIVSGVAQEEDHGVIYDVIKNNWDKREV